MRKLFDDMSATLRAFLEQRRDLTLVVKAGPAEFVPMISILNGLEEESADTHWLFLDAFKSVDQYLAAVTTSFRDRYLVLAPEFRKEGFPCPEDLPPATVDPRLPPHERLRALFVFARTLVPDLEEGHVIIGLLPSENTNPNAFFQLMASLLEHSLPIPWCHHMRFIVREDPARAPLFKHAATQPHFRLYAPDMGPQSLEDSLVVEVNDDKTPLPQRMQSLLLLAGIDLGHRRYKDSLEKYQLLAKYHQVMGPLPMYALCLNGIGEVHDRSGDKKQAKRYYEMALTPAIEAQNPPALINITTNLANLHRLAGDYPTAYEYYVGLSQLAKGALSAELQLRCLEQMGFCKYKLKDAKAAWAHWNDGVTLARAMESKEHLLDCLQRIHGLYKEAGMLSDSRKVEPEINQLQREGVRPYPA